MEYGVLHRVVTSSSDAEKLEVIGWTSLHTAAEHPTDVQCLEELLKSNSIDVNLPTIDGKTPLLIACQKKCGESAEKAVSLLLDYGANANVCDIKGRTPLLKATMKGKLEVVVQLLNCGLADPDYYDNAGRSPVLEAGVRGHWEIVRCLLQANASVQAQDGNGTTLIFLAAEHGESDMLKELLQIVVDRGQKKLIDLLHIFQGTPLMAAAKNGHLECVKLLLHYGADAHFHTDRLPDLNPNSVTALHFAIWGNHIACVEQLLLKVDFQQFLYSPNSTAYLLQIAVQRKSFMSLIMLLSRGIPVDSTYRRVMHFFYDWQGLLDIYRPSSEYILALPHYETSLSFATALGDTESMKILLSYGASVNPVICARRNENGVTNTDSSFPPVFSALNNESCAALDMLIEHGCDISYHRDDIPSNECLLYSFCEYDFTKKLLMCGSDPHLLFQKGNFKSLKYFVCQLLMMFDSTSQNGVLCVLDLLLQFTAVTEPLENSFVTLSAECKNILKEEYDTQSWNAILEQTKKPSSLQNLCRIKIRQRLIFVHGYSSFGSAINHLWLPDVIKKYLLYHKLNENADH